VRNVRPGQRVAAVSYHAFAEYDVAAADAVVPLPPELDAMPVPGEALGCAFNVLRRSRVEPGMSVAIVGVGFLGAALVQLCTRAGADVVALSRRPFSLLLAERMGARPARSLEHAQELNGGALFERVIEAGGVQETLDLATSLAAVRGVLVLAGFHQGARTVDLQLWNWRGLDVVNAHERDPAAYVRGMGQAVEAIGAGTLDPTPLCTHRFPLARLRAALDTAVARPDGFVKALVEP
jgi:threonine dehydrogenase-like Zn-dependent dehydrogenase